MVPRGNVRDASHLVPACRSDLRKNASVTRWICACKDPRVLEVPFLIPPSWGRRRQAGLQGLGCLDAPSNLQSWWHLGSA